MRLKTVTLPNGMETTALGFGCSALVGGRTRAQSLRLLEAAFDAGVRHFDVARVYGTGDAEAVVGEFARRRRDEITIATKFGIDPLPQTAAVAVAKTLLRPVMRRSRSVLQIARRNARHAMRGGQFSPDHARTSLAASLERLGTASVDVFLLHDCSAGDWDSEELRLELDGLVRQGRIGSYGTATTFAETTEVLDAAVSKPAVAQFDSDVVTGNIERLRSGLNGSLAITYGCLSRAMPAIRTAIMSDASLADDLSRELGIDLRSADELASILLASAVQANSSGITLFSAGDPLRIARNVEAIDRSRYSEDQISAFTSRVRALVVGSSAS